MPNSFFNSTKITPATETQGNERYSKRRREAYVIVSANSWSPKTIDWLPDATTKTSLPQAFTKTAPFPLRYRNSLSTSRITQALTDNLTSSHLIANSIDNSTAMLTSAIATPTRNRKHDVSKSANRFKLKNSKISRIALSLTVPSFLSRSGLFSLTRLRDSLLKYLGFSKVGDLPKLKFLIRSLCYCFTTLEAAQGQAGGAS
ncbi:HLH DNA-binding domain superfamily protein [Dorcoceras hygrometricum]|uniref:HLH DNA-binding domain superfamily protein n=1 Tax=Dorcoceras hygrometricum TaxID=472368 RepID=A0A2Z7B0I5_9LAMI|nr:HLH DNA-binding domain superfamily protein [Dorcoceras hygrometricum]